MAKFGDELASEGGGWGGGLGVSLGSNIRLLWGYFTLIGGKLRGFFFFFENIVFWDNFGDCLRGI